MTLKSGIARAFAGLGVLVLTGCYQVGTLDGSQVEQVKVDGRIFQVRIAPTGNPDEYRMLIVRGTMVINPDSDLEMNRAREVSRRFMNQTCKGRDYDEILAGLQADINYRVLFRCK